MGLSVVIGAFYGAMALLIGDSDYALYTFKYVFAFFVLVALARAYFYSDSKDALWSALEKDYLKVDARPDRMPMSGGMFGSSDLDDMSAAKSYADKEGLTVCRVSENKKVGPCIQIPWRQIESVEVVKPDEEFLESVGQAAAALLNAKLKLRRKRKAMTLVVPWHEQFARYAPPSVEIIKEWDWPFVVM